MVVFVLRRVSPSLRGELTRWLLQPHTGVYVGTVSSRVRQRLWDRICKSLKGGAAIMIYPAATEQGFAVEASGKTRKCLEDFEGLVLAETRVSK
jgi:CRISPR-associated protein Cas2